MAKVKVTIRSEVKLHLKSGLGITKIYSSIFEETSRKDKA